MKNNYIEIDATIDFDRELTEEEVDDFTDMFLDLIESWGATCCMFHKQTSDGDYE